MTFEQENILPHAAFFPENLMFKRETNTYLQAKADEKAARKTARPGPSGGLAASNVPESVTFPTNEHRRVLQLKIQRDVEDRNKALAVYEGHAG
jgi:hypothetical protein